MNWKVVQGLNGEPGSVTDTPKCKCDVNAGFPLPVGLYTRGRHQGDKGAYAYSSDIGCEVTGTLTTVEVKSQYHLGDRTN